MTGIMCDNQDEGGIMRDKKKAENTEGPMGMGSDMPPRQSARGVLDDKIRHAEEYLNGLITLMQSIPWNVLREEDEENLYKYFVRRNH